MDLVLDAGPATWAPAAPDRPPVPPDTQAIPFAVPHPAPLVLAAGPRVWTLDRTARFVRIKYARLLSATSRHTLKRGLDVCVAGAALVALLPLFAVIAALIKATDRGPVLFWQTRVGRWGRPFACPKFRSMVPDAEALLPTLLAQNHHAAGVTFKLKRDPRLTWVGGFLRRLSLDELPQLWCVLVGHMTLVGPRPAVQREVAQYTLADRRRLEVTPGLTCIWQVSGRGDVPFPQQVRMDVEYIDTQSPWLDLKLMLKTVPVVVSGKGAY